MPAHPTLSLTFFAVSISASISSVDSERASSIFGSAIRAAHERTAAGRAEPTKRRRPVAVERSAHISSITYLTAPRAIVRSSGRSERGEGSGARDHASGGHTPRRGLPFGASKRVRQSEGLPRGTHGTHSHIAFSRSGYFWGTADALQLYAVTRSPLQPGAYMKPSMIGW